VPAMLLTGLLRVALDDWHGEREAELLERSEATAQERATIAPEASDGSFNGLAASGEAVASKLAGGESRDVER
jgi:hypothetical protein